MHIVFIRSLKFGYFATVKLGKGCQYHPNCVNYDPDKPC